MKKYYHILSPGNHMKMIHPTGDKINKNLSLVVFYVFLSGINTSFYLFSYFLDKFRSYPMLIFCYIRNF